MFGLSTIQTYITIGGLGAMLSMGGVIWALNAKIEDKNTEIAIGLANLTNETIAHEITTASFEETTAAYGVVRAELGTLNEQLRELGQINDDLEDKLARHDLEALSLAKPALIERIINRATADVMVRIETITGGSQ